MDRFLKRPAVAMPRGPQSKRPCQEAKKSGAHVYQIWPSDLARAGHTTVSVDDPNEPLYKFFEAIKQHPQSGLHMGRGLKAPCLLQQSSKFRNGAGRWWCPVHQGPYGKLAHLEEMRRTGVRSCEHATSPIDCVRAEDVPTFCLVAPDEVGTSPDNYCELAIWLSLPPAIDTAAADSPILPSIRVRACKESGGKAAVEASFPAVTVRDLTGRLSKLAQEGITVTPPTALEYFYYAENKCRISRAISPGTVAQTRPDVELVAEVRCKHCESLHEDIGDYFGGTLHKKHLCGMCGRDIFGQPNIGNPLLGFRGSEDNREVAGSSLRLESKGLRIRVWPSMPAIFWSANVPDAWGIRVLAHDGTGNSVADGTFGVVYLDGEKLDRTELVAQTLATLARLRSQDETRWAGA